MNADGIAVRTSASSKSMGGRDGGSVAKWEYWAALRRGVPCTRQ